MSSIDIKLSGTTLEGVQKYDANVRNSTEEFTYEVAKCFDGLDDWYLTDNVLTFWYSGDEPDVEYLKERVELLADCWKKPVDIQ